MSTPSQSKENRLFLTNNYSIMSKYSASKKGYFKDEILEDLIESQLDGNKSPLSNRTPQVNRGYWARQMAMEWWVDVASSLEVISCVIILGAGFDTLSLRKRAKLQCHWIEIDLPYVMEFKCNYIKSKMTSSENDVITSSDGSVASFSALNLHLVSCDLRNQADLIQKLSLIAQCFRYQELNRVTVINEVCLCYLEPIEVRQIFETLKRFLRDHGTMTMKYIGFEQVKAFEGSKFARVMINHFDYMGFPLKNFPTQEELLDLLVKTLNFKNVTIINMYQVYHNILSGHREVMTTKQRIEEPFDEFEELDLYLSHYALVTGKLILNSDIQAGSSATSSESCDELTGRLNTMKLGRPRQLSITHNPSIKRYGQSSCVLEDYSDSKIALVSGGFGKYIDSRANQLQHNRLNDCVLVGLSGQDNVITCLNLNVDPISESQATLSRMHGQVCHLEDGFVFFTGGRQSPQKCHGAYDKPFMARVNKTDLKLEFVTKMKAVSQLRWRHKTLRLGRDKLIQVGGISGDLNPTDCDYSLYTWDLSSDKFGRYDLHPHDNSSLDRHSFGADLMDSNTMLMFGGLKASGSSDGQIYGRECVIVDLRSAQISTFEVDASKRSYDCQVNSISDHQFIKLGGISTLSGLPHDVVDLYDLRYSNSGLPVTSEPLPYVDTDLIFIPTKMTSVHFRQTKEIVSVGGGGNLFTFGTHFNDSHLRYNYSS